MCFIYTTVYCVCYIVFYNEYSLSLQIIAFMVLLAVSHTSRVRVCLYQEHIRKKGGEKSNSLSRPVISLNELPPAIQS